jgi:hypothetical protein
MDLVNLRYVEKPLYPPVRFRHMKKYTFKIKPVSLLRTQVLSKLFNSSKVLSLEVDVINVRSVGKPSTVQVLCKDI